ncbi:MAG: hypothetical protein RR202_02965 [Bacteroidales bacterium]
MRTLLFLQTNSIISKDIIEYALALAQDLNVKIKFIHIHYPEILYSASLATNMELFQSPSRHGELSMEEIQQTEKLLEELKGEGKIDTEVHFEYFTGVPEVILKSKLLKGEFDMIAIYNEFFTSGMNPYQPLKNIIKNMRCPIWVIPDASYKGISTVLYSTDYQEQDVKSIKLLFQIIGSNIKKLTFLHLTERVDFHQRIISIGFKTYLSNELQSKIFSSLVINTNENKTIPEYFQKVIEKDKNTLIVALKENKNIFQKVFYRSFTTKLLKGIEELVLILHSEGDFPTQEEEEDEF